MKNSRFSIRVQYQKEIEKVIENLDRNSKRILEEDPSLRSIVEDALRVGFRKKTISKSNLDQSLSVARGLIDQLKDKFSMKVFYTLLTDYLINQAYDNEASPEMNQFLKDIYRKNTEYLIRGDVTEDDIVAQVGKFVSEVPKEELEDIVYNQMHIAAVYASIQMIKNSGIAEHMEMYFDVSPESCEICQKRAYRNPYTLEQAEKLMLPHRGCTCMWVACLKY
jgi:hypothetical protein